MSTTPQPFPPLPPVAAPGANRPALPAAPTPRLWRSRSNRVVAGVLGGFAEKFHLEPRPVRLLYGLLTVLSMGALAVPYLGMWWIAPQRGPERIGPRLWRSSSSVVVGGLLGGLAEKFGVRPAFVRVPFVALTALTGVLPGVLGYLVLWAVTRPLDAPAPRAP
jgi:phage shock protein C